MITRYETKFYTEIQIYGDTKRPFVPISADHFLCPAGKSGTKLTNLNHTYGQAIYATEYDGRYWFAEINCTDVTIWDNIPNPDPFEPALSVLKLRKQAMEIMLEATPYTINTVIEMIEGYLRTEAEQAEELIGLNRELYDYLLSINFLAYVKE